MAEVAICHRSIGLKNLCKHGHLKEALSALKQILYRSENATPQISGYSDDLEPLETSDYISLLKGCARDKSLAEATLVHEHIIRARYPLNTFVLNTLINTYAQCGSMEDARSVFQNTTQKNVYTWTIMISSYAGKGFSHEALDFYNLMQESGVQPNEFTAAALISACSRLGILQHGRELHAQISRNGFEKDVFVGSSLIDMYVKCRGLEDARRVFEKMPERTSVTWNCMISGYARAGMPSEANKIFQTMPQKTVESWNAMIASYGQVGDVDKALEMFDQMPEKDLVSWTEMISGLLRNGFVNQGLRLFQRISEEKRDVILCNAVITGLASNGRIKDAESLFWKTGNKAPTSWNAMICGYCQNGFFAEALELFKEMKRLNVKPQAHTFASVLPCCGSLAAVNHGRMIHVDLIKGGLDANSFVGNALLDFYVKCSSLDDAYLVFEALHLKDVVSWTSMVMGYAVHGYAKEALQFYQEMKSHGTAPDSITFLAVLHACARARLVDEGWKFFQQMSKLHKFKPTKEHYCCMVEILGRAGHLHEAEQLIEQMPMGPDSATWKSLLCACRIHADVDLGERVAEQLFKLEPKNVATYVLLSNLYAAAGRWDDVENVRKLMGVMAVKKKPGCSWIEVNKRICLFEEDMLLPNMKEIYSKLEDLTAQMRDAGYFPDTNFLLNDIAEHKRHGHSYHSEQLALAFGLFHISPNLPIRVVKNIRMCGDCHSAVKFISKLIQRRIIIRDPNAFHHFSDGQCSCGDYW